MRNKKCMNLQSVTWKLVGVKTLLKEASGLDSWHCFSRWVDPCVGICLGPRSEKNGTEIVENKCGKIVYVYSLCWLCVLIHSYYSSKGKYNLLSIYVRSLPRNLWFRFQEPLSAMNDQSLQCAYSLQHAEFLDIDILVPVATKKKKKKCSNHKISNLICDDRTDIYNVVSYTSLPFSIIY